ncbi:unnamed protein product [Vitrella brassicaformis CCMP3155]|uniref:Uncharacterized protein n=1 Tax=Vitrella brassicaformis (strain CCMP3155) TaxID=1169540 RepID=A0A0G4H6T9_VITBC|nr:unnamed protein product [Vitrella brassicaformis CCMP3155]|eukprot:CEM39403.1 unnamed protein product [Vitrella brassicaformis CCMP3155]
MDEKTHRPPRECATFSRPERPQLRFVFLREGSGIAEFTAPVARLSFRFDPRCYVSAFMVQWQREEVLHDKAVLISGDIGLFRRLEAHLVYGEPLNEGDTRILRDEQMFPNFIVFSNTDHGVDAGSAGDGGAQAAAGASDEAPGNAGAASGSRERGGEVCGTNGNAGAPPPAPAFPQSHPPASPSLSQQPTDMDDGSQPDAPLALPDAPLALPPFPFPHLALPPFPFPHLALPSRSAAPPPSRRPPALNLRDKQETGQPAAAAAAAAAVPPPAFEPIVHVKREDESEMGQEDAYSMHAEAAAGMQEGYEGYGDHGGMGEGEGEEWAVACGEGGDVGVGVDGLGEGAVEGGGVCPCSVASCWTSAAVRAGTGVSATPGTGGAFGTAAARHPSRRRSSPKSAGFIQHAAVGDLKSTRRDHCRSWWTATGRSASAPRATTTPTTAATSTDPPAQQLLLESIAIVVAPKRVGFFMLTGMPSDWINWTGFHNHDDRKQPLYRGP